MRILHTSDLHLGQTLRGNARFDEQKKALDFIAATAIQRQAEYVLISGDIFDNLQPSNQAETLFFEFLRCLRAAPEVRGVVIIRGNHDSPGPLSKAAGYLKDDGIHVVASVSGSPADEVIVLPGEENPRLIVCAVPFLTDNDVRRDDVWTEDTDRGRQMAEGIRRHYGEVRQEALRRMERLGRAVPLVAMGHFYAAGLSMREEDYDGEGSLVVGHLGNVDAGFLDRDYDYAALGHIHKALRAAGSNTVRYSGSPLPMDFGEKGAKKLLLADFEENAGTGEDGRWAGAVTVEEIPVPVFRRLVRITGSDLQTLEEQMRKAALEAPGSLVMADYNGAAPCGDWFERLRQLGASRDGSEPAVLVHLNDLGERERFGLNFGQDSPEETELSALDPREVLEFCFSRDEKLAALPEEKKGELFALFEEAKEAVRQRMARSAEAEASPGE